MTAHMGIHNLGCYYVGMFAMLCQCHVQDVGQCLGFQHAGVCLLRHLCNITHQETPFNEPPPSHSCNESHALTTHKARGVSTLLMAGGHPISSSCSLVCPGFARLPCRYVFAFLHRLGDSVRHGTPH